MSITRPGIQVSTTETTSSPTIVQPTLRACLIGPCFRLIDAFDDEGALDSDAYAGTYRDGYGTIAYDLPSFGAEDDLTGFDDEVRVFLVNSDDSYTELNSSSDEETLEAGTGDYTQASGVFEDGAALFESEGVEAGDVVRLAYMGVTYDIVIESVDGETLLTIDNTGVPENLSNVAYTVVRNPAQFAYQSSAQQSYVLLGEEGDYLSIQTQPLGDYAGSTGDGLSLTLQETSAYTSGADLAYGDCVFYDSDADKSFETAVDLEDTNYLFIGAGPGTTLTAITAVYDDNTLIVATGEGADQTGLSYVVGKQTDSGDNGATAGGDETAFSAAGQNFLTSIPQVGGAGTAPLADTFLYISGVGVYQITEVTSDEALVIAAGAGAGLSGKDFETVEVIQADTTGCFFDDDELLSPSDDFSDVPAEVTDYDVVVGGVGYTIASIAAGKVTVDAALPGDGGAAQSYGVYITDADLLVQWDATAETLTVTLARADGLSVGTLDSLYDALTNDEAEGYDADVAEVFTAAEEVGSGDLTDYLGTYTFDGGADADQLLLDADLMGSTVPTGRVYVSYKALRLDVTPAAEEPQLLSYESTTESVAALGAANAENPLSLAFYKALQNATGKSVAGIGVDDVSAARPMGTAEAYDAAFSFLEGESVYFLVPLTQDVVVQQALQVHVEAMSEPENKAFRCCLINQVLPEYSSATLVSSGTDLNIEADFATTGTMTASVDFVAAGVEAGDIVIVAALADSASSPDVAYGTQGPLYGFVVEEVGPDDDNFTLTLDVADHAALAALWASQVDVSFSIYRSGSAISTASAQATALAEIGPNFDSARVVLVWPDEVLASIDSTEQAIEGFYLAAAVAGKKSRLPPQRGLTNSTVAGFTGLRHSSGYFSSSQLDEIAGGGTMIFMQETAGGALKCRHQLTTDVASIERREWSIRTTIDYTAMFFQQSLARQVGVNNITQSYLDSLATQIQGLGRYLVEAGVLSTFSISSIGVDPDASDTVNVTVVISVPYPCNYIAIELQV